MFVCMGNICRSQLAEGVFRHMAREMGVLDRFDIASSGTGGWHVGERPDRRMSEVAAKNGISLEGQHAQQFENGDFDYYDLILVMDKGNLQSVQQLDPAGKWQKKIHMFRSFDPTPGDMEVPDPYYGGPKGFDNVFEMIDRTTRVLLDKIVNDDF